VSVCTHLCKEGVCAKQAKNVFVTSVAYDGAMGGLDGADALCQGRADSASLGGTYRAWLSDATGSPSTRFSKSGGPYVLAKRGTIVANDWAEWASGTLQHALDSTETGSTAIPLGDGPCQYYSSGRQFWSNTHDDGSLYFVGASCANWSDSTAKQSAWGLTYATYNWTIQCVGDAVGACASKSPLLCVEQ
jgi:hypothetical protein